MARASLLRFHLPDIGDAEIESAVAVLRSRWLTSGPRVEQFESEFAKRLGARFAVAVNSATAALHLALLAAGVGPGDEVVIPTMTFAATGEVVFHVGARPILVDCEPDSLNIDPAGIERALTPRTKAILPVHYGGHPCSMDPILRIARNRQIKVIEDAAHCFPTTYLGRAVGTLGDVTCFSFYATKTITTGEGGMAVTASPEFAERMKLLRLHGIHRDESDTSRADWEYEILQAGFKYNLSDIAAAIGIEQLKRSDESWNARKRIAARYDAAFGDVPEIRTPILQPGVEPSRHLYVIRLDLDKLRLDRKGFIDALRAENISASVHFNPLHLHPLYRMTLGCDPGDFPNATGAARRIVSLPIYPQMTERDVADVIEAVRATITRHRR